MILTAEQINYLKQTVKIFNNAEPLHTMSKELTMMPHIYGKEIRDYIKWMDKQNLVVQDYSEVRDAFLKNYKNDAWYNTLSHKKIVQCLALMIRADRFNDGFLLSCIRNGTFEKLVGELSTP